MNNKIFSKEYFVIILSELYSLFNINAVNKKKIKIPPRYNNKIKKVIYSTCSFNNKILIIKTTNIKQKIEINVFNEKMI
jgi:hypothetical protein